MKIFFLFFSFRGSNFSISSLCFSRIAFPFSSLFSSFLSFFVFETFVASRLPIVPLERRKKSVQGAPFFYLLLSSSSSSSSSSYIHRLDIHTHTRIYTNTRTHVIYTHKQWHPQRPALCRRSLARRRPPLLPREEV